MSTLASSVRFDRWQWLLAGALALLIWAGIAWPNLMRPRSGVHVSQADGIAAESRTKPVLMAESATQATQAVAKARISTYVAGTDAPVDRKIIRTVWLDMVVAHPSEVAQQIAGLAEGLGGYLESAEDGGPNASNSALTIRVPHTRLEQARTAIHQLGLRVNSEKIDSQDVTRQYVDEDATIRNLKAEEAQYLTILKQATTVKDMMAVSEKISEVRGQIEQQQAEFNALSRQVETVAISISLRTESEAQVFGLSWRPGYQLKLALHDGLESVANYGTAMATILFYLPAVLLWVGTIFFGGIGAWRIVRWVGKRWFVAKPLDL
jgi:hypothetical protein